MSGDSSRVRQSGDITGRSGAAIAARRSVAFSRRFRVRVLHKPRPSNAEGAGKAGCQPHP